MYPARNPDLQPKIPQAADSLSRNWESGEMPTPDERPYSPLTLLSPVPLLNRILKSVKPSNDATFVFVFYVIGILRTKRRLTRLLTLSSRLYSRHMVLP